MVLSYCVVNTNGRELLMRCLDSIERTAPDDVEYEVLVLDNASTDGSAEAVEARGGVRLVALERRRGKAENDSELLRTARGRYCLLLNEDSELLAGAPGALLHELESRPRAAVAGAQLLSPEGRAQPCAWRLPGPASALAGALFIHRMATVQSGGNSTRAVGWVQSSAMMVRRDAAESVGWLDSDFFVYSDETDFCKRLGDAGFEILYVPEARAIHHEQLSNDPGGTRRRIVEFHRGRDLYARKHLGTAIAFALRPLLAWPYLTRAAAAGALRRDGARRHMLHARQALRPGSGTGIREAAETHNRRLAR